MKTSGAGEGQPVSARIPRATFRLQFGRDLRFVDALELLDYLQALGISDIYASPIFETPPASSHGYNVCGFRLNPILGTTEEFERLCLALRARGMGFLLDIVPNHMAAHPANFWWQDVLRYGRDSRFASFFDINWELHSGKVLLPTLGSELPKVLEQGQLRLALESGALLLKYYDNPFPLSAAGCRFVLLRLNKPASALIEDVIGQLAHSPAALPETGRLLVQLAHDPEFGPRLAEVLEELNRSPAELSRLLELQHYKLAFWRRAPDEINYRRFFDITDLVALKMERVEVFEATHRQVIEWLQKGLITGLRVDHPDGLRVPRAYFRQLQQSVAPGQDKPVYVVAEKILTGDEQLPEDWEVHGTTGYDFLIALNALFVDPGAEPAFTNFYATFTGERANFHTLELAAKKEVLEMSFRGEISRLAESLRSLASRLAPALQLTPESVRAAVVELICNFPVYRTYSEPEIGRTSERDQNVILHSLSAAKRAGQADSAILDFLAVLLQRTDLANDAEACEFIWRFQQLSGPLTAKGVEDTAFYRYFRFASLNEVGGNPAQFGASPARLHARLAQQAKHWPHSLLASSTHDTKRGEDTRARLNAISEFPGEWGEFVTKSSKLNQPHKHQSAPDPIDEYLIYQTILSSSGFSQDWPALADRSVAYMLKAAREGKRNTSWINQNSDYEKGLESFIRAILNPDTSAAFLALMLEFRGKLEFFGALNSIAQTLVKITAPGVPDFYQGAELWDFSLVDPDNRQPVDFPARRRALNEVQQKAAKPRPATLQALLREHASPEIKLFVITEALRARHAHARLFEQGQYEALAVQGPAAEHFFAFARTLNGRCAITIIPRLTVKLCRGIAVWPPQNGLLAQSTIEIPAQFSGKFREQFSGKQVATGALNLGDTLAEFPLALLLPE